MIGKFVVKDLQNPPHPHGSQNMKIKENDDKIKVLGTLSNHFRCLKNFKIFKISETFCGLLKDPLDPIRPFNIFIPLKSHPTKTSRSLLGYVT